MENIKPRFGIGDTISWVCNSCDKIHEGVVKFAVPEFTYNCPNYEVSVVCCGEEKTMYIDEWDVLPKDL